MEVSQMVMKPWRVREGRRKISSNSPSEEKMNEMNPFSSEKIATVLPSGSRTSNDSMATVSPSI